MSLESPVQKALISGRRFFTGAEVSDDDRTLFKKGGRQGDVFYRDRWSHDKVVRSTHGVNCTGLVLVEGLRQGRDHHLGDPADRLPQRPAPTGPSTSRAAAPAARRSPGTPTRPTRVRYPYVRGVLLEMYREAKARYGDPVVAWADDRRGPGAARRYKAARGKGGLVRASWEEVAETGRRRPRLHGQALGARTASPASRRSRRCRRSRTPPGARFLELIGAPMLSFYDWYADLPNASPQMFGDQTDVPGVRGLVGRGLPDDVGLQPPDHPHPGCALDDRGALPRPEGRRRRARLRRERQVRRRVGGPRTRAPTGAGDGDGARDPQGVLRRPAGRRTSPTTTSASPTCRSWSRLRGRRRRRLPAGQVSRRRRPRPSPRAAARTRCGSPSCSTRDRRGRSCPNGSLGHRFGEEGMGRWNLDLGDVDPVLSAVRAGATSR